MPSWDELTFGFEFEFIGKASEEAQEKYKAFMVENNIPYVFTGVYGKNSTDAWTLGADCSLVDYSMSESVDMSKRTFGYELVSPILHVSDFPVIDKRDVACAFLIFRKANQSVESAHKRTTHKALPM